MMKKGCSCCEVKHEVQQVDENESFTNVMAYLDDNAQDEDDDLENDPIALFSPYISPTSGLIALMYYTNYLRIASSRLSQFAIISRIGKHSISTITSAPIR